MKKRIDQILAERQLAPSREKAKALIMSGNVYVGEQKVLKAGEEYEEDQHLQGWTLDRIPKTSLAILRLSAAQLLYMKDIPVAVVISEAVQLAKRFGDSGDYVFINGALSSFEKSLPEDGRNENG